MQTCWRIDLDELTAETGAAYPRSLGVEGPESQLRAASGEFGHNALALTLHGSFLRRYRGGDVRRRDEIPNLFEGRGQCQHAGRVMAWHAKQSEGRPEGERLHVLGLLGRPAPWDAVQALFAGRASADGKGKGGGPANGKALPPIKALTERLDGLSDEEWADTLEALRESRLLSYGVPFVGLPLGGLPEGEGVCGAGTLFRWTETGSACIRRPEKRNCPTASPHFCWILRLEFAKAPWETCWGGSLSTLPVGEESAEAIGQWRREFGQVFLAHQAATAFPPITA